MLNKKENWIFYLLNIVTLTIYSLFAKLYGDSNNNISEKEEYEYKCNGKNKVLKKEFDKIIK